MEVGRCGSAILRNSPWARPSWRAELIARGKTRELSPALSIRPLAPWSPDGRHYAYQAFDRATRSGRLLLTDVASGDAANGPSGQLIDSVLWSPTQPVLVIALPRGAALIGADGTDLAEASWPGPDGEFAHVGWLPSGRVWFAVSRAGVDAQSEIHFHDLAGDVVDRAKLDPLDLVPYDAAAYRRISRETWSLRIGAGTWSVGSLLDRWGQARYDAGTGRLMLSVLRPRGVPSKADAFGRAELGVRAEQRWITLELSD
ncbi:MAG: hypothetical protein AUH85_10195 [Chloroflexi bacterium 13_1_40CM_4_68_4]|nr:MAG: hypothetical protein AUH85_10195 [Chloroflexi bacterium 13_1_40CM_4_68_4]